MQPELKKLFEAQAAWQRARARLSWPEKIRIAEMMRESAMRLRASRYTKPRGSGNEPKATAPAKGDSPSGH
jgi:hypothetical protein